MYQPYYLNPGVLIELLCYKYSRNYRIQNSLNLKKFLRTKRIKTHYYKTHGIFYRDLKTSMI